MENITLTTPMTHTQVVLRPWMTGREEMSIKGILSDALDIELTEAGRKVKVDATSEQSAAIKAMEILLVSVGADTVDPTNPQKLVDAVLNLPGPDSTKVQEKVKEIMNDPGLSDEKKSESPNSQSSSPVMEQDTPTTS